jgi:hypothetical protein
VISFRILSGEPDVADFGILFELLVYSGAAFTGANGPNWADQQSCRCPLDVAQISSPVAHPAEYLRLSVPSALLVNRTMQLLVKMCSGAAVVFLQAGRILQRSLDAQRWNRRCLSDRTVAQQREFLSFSAEACAFTCVADA